jgi:hypothetical protein
MCLCAGELPITSELFPSAVCSLPTYYSYMRYITARALALRDEAGRSRVRPGV